MQFDTIARDLTKIFGGEVPDDATLADVFETIVEGEKHAQELSVLKDKNGLWMDLDDGMASRSVIREDKKTYHQGKLLETFGALEDSIISLGKSATMIEIPLIDKQGQMWKVDLCIWGDTHREDGCMEIRQVDTPTGSFWKSTNLTPEIEGPIWISGDDPASLLKYNV